MKNINIFFILISLFLIYSCDEDKINKVQSDEIEWIGPLNPDGSKYILDITSNKQGTIFYSVYDTVFYKSADNGNSWSKLNSPNTEFNMPWIKGVKNSGPVLFDTTYEDKNFLISLFTLGVTPQTLWSAVPVGNPPDQEYSEPTLNMITMFRLNGEERTVKFYQKIPEIDSLVIKLKELCFKLYQ